MRVQETETCFELKVKDLSNVPAWSLLVNKIRAVDFAIGDIYRVRGVFVESNQNVITCQKTTNFLKLGHHSQVYRELQQQVQEDIQDQIENEDELLMKPRYATRVTTEDLEMDENKLKFYRLQDLFCDYDSLTDEEKKANSFRVRMQVLKVDPVDLKEACVAMC